MSVNIKLEPTVLKPMCPRTLTVLEANAPQAGEPARKVECTLSAGGAPRLERVHLIELRELDADAQARKARER